ncbi:hypothetical protein EES44_24675 [Streptomyces sp. ADI96-15]|uniref:hypothetical protein n=1 Tax=Streptomyces TaxID=1883 RepID=UPI000F552114|nr:MULTISPECIES: hypothetical protein [Streptomyces]MDH6189204.1 DNA-binding NarL/FixJ family response regulator [Streptomyces sp. CZ24]RPK58131.1 hypothetical protein EES44_24675 [Streptomyces sp. ADI96-15]RWZ74907.1 hypothetical protein EQK42_16505 [Streptomyces albidoflavus]
MYGDTWDNGVDLAAVERATSMRGACPPLNRAEQRRAVRVMTEAGWSEVAIRKRLGLSERTVRGWRQEMGLSCG